MYVPLAQVISAPRVGHGQRDPETGRSCTRDRWQGGTFAECLVWAGTHI